MLTLLSEIHFWSCQEDICIKDNDYGSFRYHERKDNLQSSIAQSKKSYAEKRDYVWNITNKRPVKLRDKLKDLEELIQQNKIVYCKWSDNCMLKVMLSTGLIINIYVNIYTGDVQKISFDKYFIGKLQSEYISDVLITRTNLLCTYNDNQVTVVHFNKSLVTQNTCEKFSRLEPKIQVSELAGPSGRKLDRRISSNLNGDKILIWWRCMRDEVYPWSPLVKDQDRANIHIYSLNGCKMELLCYRRTEFDPVSVTFSKIHQHIIHCVEQKVSRKGDVTVETCTFEIIKNKLQQLLITSIPLQTQVCCHSFSPDNEKLLLGCIDGSVVLFDHGRGVTHLVKAAFIPTILSWHPDGAVIMVANEKCQIQCFDISLACIKSQLTSEDITPSSIIDLASYFRNQPTLLKLTWNNKTEVQYFCSRYLQTDSVLLLVFEKGPLAMLRLFSSSGLRGDVHTSGLTPDNLVYNYISMNQVERAIGILLSLNWDMYATSCLMSLHRIVNHLFKQHLTPERETQIQRALGSFYVPLQPISESIQADFGEQVKDITRKFFHLLVRYQLFEKAFCLAIDVNDYDLFMDLFYYAQVLNDQEMASAALNKAKDLINNTSDSSGHSTCSRSSCSQCSDSENSYNSDDVNWSRENYTKEIIPPLPVATKIPNLIPPSLPTYTPPLPVPKTQQNSTVTTSSNSSRLLNIPPFPQIRTIAPNKTFFPIQNQIIKPNIQPIIRSTELLKPKIDPIPPNIFKANIESTSLRLKTPFAPQRFAPPVGFRPQTSTLFTAPVVSPREIVHKTVSMNIPPPPSITNSARRLNTVHTIQTVTPLKLSLPTQSTSGIKSTTGEKNKVKFSDTVTAFIVPEIQRSEKPKEKVKRGNGSMFMTDPKQELADSLPLCHPNEEYLKDFTPISNSSEEEGTASKIQVVHFGMV